MLYVAWLAEPFRTTRDLDLLYLADHETAPILEIIRNICSQPLVDDGLHFDTENILAATFGKDSDYGAIRVRTSAQLGVAIIPVQIDIGFGDIVTPAPLELEYPFFSITHRPFSTYIYAKPWLPRTSKPLLLSTSQTAV